MFRLFIQIYYTSLTTFKYLNIKDKKRQGEFHCVLVLTVYK